MGDETRPQVLLDPEIAAFMQGGVSVVVAGRTANLVPDVVRACGCRVSHDLRRVTVLIDSARAADLFECIRNTGTIAVVFSQPSTHRTIQLKAVDADIAPATPADRKVVERHLRAWVAELTSIGFQPDFATAVRGRIENGLAAISFTPAAAFEQTPGPGAGQKLGAGAA